MADPITTTDSGHPLVQFNQLCILQAQNELETTAHILSGVHDYLVATGCVFTAESLASCVESITNVEKTLCQKGHYV